MSGLPPGQGFICSAGGSQIFIVQGLQCLESPEGSMSIGGSTGTLNGATGMTFEKKFRHSHLPKDKQHEKA